MATTTDDFNRADSGDLGANWDAGYTSKQAFQIVGNRVRVTTAGGTDAFETNNAAVSDPDQSVKITISTFGTASYKSVGVLLRCAAPATVTGYLAEGTPTTTQIGKLVAGSHTAIASGGAAPVANDVVEGRTNGTKVSVWLNGALRAEGTDSAITGPGRYGLFMICDAASVANVEADNFIAEDMFKPTLRVNQPAMIWR